MTLPYFLFYAIVTFQQMKKITIGKKYLNARIKVENFIQY